MLLNWEWRVELMKWYYRIDLPALRRIEVDSAMLFPYFGNVVLKSEPGKEEWHIDIAAIEWDVWPKYTLACVWNATIDSGFLSCLMKTRRSWLERTHLQEQPDLLLRLSGAIRCQQSLPIHSGFGLSSLQWKGCHFHKTNMLPQSAVHSHCFFLFPFHGTVWSEGFGTVEGVRRGR